MKTSVIGYPRIGALRELKFATEKYFRQELSREELLHTAETLRMRHWKQQAAHAVSYIPSGDFSFYDLMLDTAVMLGLVPARYRSLSLPLLDTYFAMARGYQGPHGDVKALAMKKWFNTNYHYLVPEIDDDMEPSLADVRVLAAFEEARQAGFRTKPVLIGPFTFLKLAHYTGTKCAADFADAVAQVYRALLERLANAGATWVQFDEPYLVMDLTEGDRALFTSLYQALLPGRGNAHVLLQTYFGDVRDCYVELTRLDFDGIGLDFVEGQKNLKLVQAHGFPKGKSLFAGLVNGKNIWKNRYAATCAVLDALRPHCSEIVLSTSCSLLHVPYTLQNETHLSAEQRQYFAFAEEKLAELAALSALADVPDPTAHPDYQENERLFTIRRTGADPKVQARVAALTPQDAVRQPVFAVREQKQKETFRLPLLPTTTIGSFPQTADVKAARSGLHKGTLTRAAYVEATRRKIAECIALQEQLGLDVLVHGEFERNDMVEYFGEHLNGFVFTEKAWVQSYGTRCVKPPIIWGDVSRRGPITVSWSVYAQSLTKKPVKGMLTGPVTILNWSFPREDLPLSACARQIALAIREEVLELEANGIRIIQIDEAALREKLPLRHADWKSAYLDWAIPAFRIVHSGVRPETQIHTHMCYSEFADIIREIDDMDADVITFEASRSDLSILNVLQNSRFRTEVGPGVYDIHSPRIPTVGEIQSALHKMLEHIPKEKLWVNPDCGLKTRGQAETVASLQNLVQAAEEVRHEIV